MTVKPGATTVAGTVGPVGGREARSRSRPTRPLPADTDLHGHGLPGVVSTDGASAADGDLVLPHRGRRYRPTSLLDGVTPATAAVDDTSAIELGMAFTPSQAGSVTAIRFYKGAGNTGTHTGSLWTLDGHPARPRSPSPTRRRPGWQTANLRHAARDDGRPDLRRVLLRPERALLGDSRGFFATPRTVGPLTARAGDNGRYRYGAGGGFPTELLERDELLRRRGLPRDVAVIRNRIG